MCAMLLAMFWIDGRCLETTVFSIKRSRVILLVGKDCSSLDIVGKLALLSNLSYSILAVKLDMTVVYLIYGLSVIIDLHAGNNVTEGVLGHNINLVRNIG
jgi:hypothetical protein